MWGYWLSYGNFEGGFKVPDGETSGELYDDLKRVIESGNPKRVEDDQEFERRCDKNQTSNMHEKVKKKLEQHEYWTAVQLKDAIDKDLPDVAKLIADKKAKKRRVPSNTKIQRKPSAEEEVLGKAGVSGAVRTAEKQIDGKQGSTKPGKLCDGISSSSEANVPKVLQPKEKPVKAIQTLFPSQEEAKEDCQVILQRYNDILDEDIKELEEEINEMNEKKRKFIEEAYQGGSEEVSMDMEIQKNEKKLEANIKRLKKAEEGKIKGEMMKEVEGSEKMLKELDETFVTTKDKIEGGLAKLKEVENLKQKPKCKIETFRMIETSKETVVVLNMDGVNFNRQPESVEKDLRFLKNAKIVNLNPRNWDTVAVELKNIEPDEENTAVLVIVVAVDKNLDSSDKEMFDINISSYLTKMKAMLEKGKTKFEKIMLVFPPATEGSIRALKAVLNKTKDVIREEFKVCNLFEIQEEMGSKLKDEDIVKIENHRLAKKMYNEETGNMSEFAVRYVWSTTALLTDTGEMKTICGECALLHSSSKCPPDAVETGKKDEKSERKNSKEEVEPRERRRENKPGGHRDSRLGKRTRSPFRKPILTEECYRCLGDHDWTECNFGPNFKCSHCDCLGHHRKSHHAKKPETIALLKKLYKNFEIIT